MDFQFDNERPIYLQLADALRRQIVAGQFQPGERLSSVRDLALQAKVNPNTMQKALSELESAGLIFTERTNGKFVTSDSFAIEKARRALAKSHARRYLCEMQSIGLSPVDAAQYLTKVTEHPAAKEVNDP